MVNALPPSKRAGSTSTKRKASSQAPAPSASSTTPTSPSDQSEITRLSSLLPPSAPRNANLNPLADLVALFIRLPLAPPNRPTASATLSAQERNRQVVHAALHALKATFEHLLSTGRIHGVPAGTSAAAAAAVSAKLGSGVATAKKQKLNSAARPTRDQDEDEVEQEQGQREAKALLAVKAWLTSQYTTYLSHLVNVASSHWDATLRSSALSAAMSLIRTEASVLTTLSRTKQARWPEASWKVVVRALLLPSTVSGELDGSTVDEWKKWWDRCDDVRFYFLKEAAALLSTFTPTSAPAALSSNLLRLLESLTTMPTAASELNEWFASVPTVSAATATNGSKKRKAPTSAPISDGSTGVFDSSSSSSEDENPASTKLTAAQRRKLLPPLLSLQAHKRVFQDCWLALLALPMGGGEQKRVLAVLHRQVLDHFVEPQRLMDWLSDCADAGGTTAILALNGLFTLITKHNLEYPDFFTKLYAILDSSVLHVRYRARFFRLLEVFMGSSHLPSALVASFIKRLARLSISAPPAAGVTVLPFIYNMLKLHPSCMVMIHRPSDAAAVETDPFGTDESDPLKTNALSSSLWEIATLQKHYSASVSGLAKVFNEVMSKQSYAMEDFLDHSYATMFEAEMTRKIRSAPALAPVPKRQPIGDSFFPPALSSSAMEERSNVADTEEEDTLEPVDLVSGLWTF